MAKFDLNERLINYAVLIIRLSHSIENCRAGNHLSGQMMRSGTSPSLNYSEAQAAESRRDFGHKMSIVLKELRETQSCLKILEKAGLSNDNSLLNEALNESNELISIFAKSLRTLKS